MEKVITREQYKKWRQEGRTAEQIKAFADAKGYKFVDTQTPITPTEPIKRTFGIESLPKANIQPLTAQQIGDFVGGSKIGTGLKVLALQQSPEFKDIEQRISRGIASPEEIKLYQETLGEYPTPKQVAGDVLQMGTSLASVGTLKGVQAPAFLKPISSAITGTQKVIGNAQKLPGVQGSLSRMATAGATGAAFGGTQGAATALKEGKSVAPEVESGIRGGFLFGGALQGGLELAKYGIPALSRMGTGVEKKYYDIAYENPDKFSQVSQYVKDNKENPYYKLANETGQQINSLKEEAKTSWDLGVKEFEKKYPQQRINVGQNAQSLREKLKPFGLTVNSDGSAVIPSGKVSQFDKKEIEYLSSLMNDIKNAKNLKPNDLLRLKEKVSSYYDKIPLGVNGNPKQYHAAVMNLVEGVDDVISKVSPEELKTAFQNYRQYYDVLDGFGKRIVDGQGNVKVGAEQFLSNIGNLNKGEQRKIIDGLRSVLGVDLIQEVEMIKAAQQFNNLFPQTGSRTQDIVRSGLIYGGGGLGLTTGNPLVSGAIFGATSPSVAGGVTQLSGKVAQSKAAQEIGKKSSKILPYLKKVGSTMFNR